MSDWSELKRLAESVPDNYSNETAQYVIFSDAADPQAILALIAESEALRKDAERYRWLRTYAHGAMGYVELEDLFSYNDSIIDEKVDDLRKEPRNG